MGQFGKQEGGKFIVIKNESFNIYTIEIEKKNPAIVSKILLYLTTNKMIISHILLLFS